MFDSSASSSASASIHPFPFSPEAQARIAELEAKLAKAEEDKEIIRGLAESVSKTNDELHAKIHADRLKRFGLEDEQPPKEERTDYGPQGGFKFLGAAELFAERKPIAFAIKGLVPDDAITFLFGDYETCKTVLGIDWNMSMATGQAWNGRAVKQGPVFFILGEGHQGFANRVLGWCIRNHVDPKSLEGKVFVSQAPGDLIDAASARAVMESIKAAGVGNPAGICIDTMARNFGAGDENNTRDANLFYNNIDTYLRRPFDAAVMVLGHVGHLEKDRLKGARQLIGNADAAYHTAAVDDTILLCCKKSKEFEKPETLTFKRRPVELGFQDEEGRGVTSVVLHLSDVNQASTKSVNQTQKPTRMEEEMLAVLDELLELVRENRAEGGYDPELGRVSITHWRKTLEERGICKARQLFHRYKAHLKGKGFIEYDDAFVKPCHAR